MSTIFDQREATGSRRYFRPLPHLFPKFVVSDQAYCLALDLEILFLLETIARSQMRPEIWRNPMLRKIQLWTLEVAEDDSATLEVRSQEDEEGVIMEKYEWVDIPPNSFTFIVIVTALGRHQSDPTVFQYCFC